MLDELLAGISFPVGAHQAAIYPHRGEDEVHRFAGRGDPCGLAQRETGLRERSRGEPVPSGQDLRIGSRTHPGVPRREERPADALLCVRFDHPRVYRDALAFEVAGLGEPECLGRQVEVVTGRVPDLIQREGVELALLALGVGIERRPEPARRVAHLSEQPGDRHLGDLPVTKVAGVLPRARVGAEELSVVVEHLLEMRHEPLRIDRVTMKAAAKLIVNSPRGHFVQRPRHHYGQETPSRRRCHTRNNNDDQVHRMRKLRRTAKSAIAGDHITNTQGAAAACESCSRFKLSGFAILSPMLQPANGFPVKKSPRSPSLTC